MGVSILVGSTALLSGCAAVRTEVGTMSAICFTAIPVARAAMGKPAPVPAKTTTGTTAASSSSTAQAMTTTTTTARMRPGPDPVFAGVLNSSQKQIDAFGKTHNYLHSLLVKRNGGPIRSVCLVAFRGSFDPATMKYVTGPIPPVGHRLFAVAVVAEPHDKLLATFIRSRAPIRFNHYTVGGG
jgi:hypothetical protein